jgi:cellulose synthase/poly-beta-1,6-N-acetylglucosamine synthase-like glycosyltransferase
MIVSVIYFIVYFLLFVVLLILLVTNGSLAKRPLLQTQPKVSILIAARNEEKTILRCLQSIEKLAYPREKVEVLIGDDASTDNTRAVVEHFILDKPNYRCITITENMGKARGKANVLAHLAKHATTDFYFYTDADIAVPPSWLNSMLAQLNEGIGIVTGITTIAGNSLFARLQALDWLYALGLMQVISDMGLPVSTMGNNMLLRRQAYESTGGYENLEFSVTEDVALFNSILKKGWGFKNCYHSNVLALSLPASSFLDFLHQRKRWMTGSMHLPFYMILILGMHSAYYPVLLPFYAYTSVGIVVGIFVFKLLLQSIYLHACLRKLNKSVPWWLYVLVEFYFVISSIILIIYFLLPISFRWKGRKY